MTEITRIALLFIPGFVVLTLALLAAQRAIDLLSSAWVFNLLQRGLS